MDENENNGNSKSNSKSKRTANYGCGKEKKWGQKGSQIAVDEKFASEDLNEKGDENPDN